QCLVGLPNAHSELAFLILYAAIGFVEGIILVATPALIRDFSPQLGRASAMGFWTLGPVLGSLVVAAFVSGAGNRSWQDQYRISGVIGLIVFAVALIGLRELSPRLRDQLMVSRKDRELIEARAAGIDIEASLRHPFRQMLRPDILLSAFAISVFLIIYYLAVGFFPAYFQTIFGFSQKDANGLGNWNWSFNALALLLIGFASDKVRVRKPFMVVGAVGAIIMTIVFLSRATHPHTSYYTFVVILSLLAVSLGVAYAPWMASFTETVERRNPALTATGLAVWGLVIRIVIAVSVFIVPHVVNTVTTLVEKGAEVQAGAVPGFTAEQNATVRDIAADPTIVPKVQSLAAKYKTELATAAKLQPATQAALATNPNDVNAQIEALHELSGVAVGDVTTVVQLNLAHGPALQAGAAIDTSTATILLTDPTDKKAAATAVGEIVQKLKVSQQQAIALITELRSIPIPQLLTVQANGPKVLASAAQLKALGVVPAADLAFLGKYGPSLQNPKVVAILTKVKNAADNSPKQWQHYYWIAVGGEIVFIPLIFLLAGFWSPRKAREKEEEHERWVEAELAKLGSGASTPGT
ncbi:MAG: MFS transporter, partial [Jatrophihabitantaceae bacterium]